MVVEAEAEQGIVEIVDARDGGEHALDGLFTSLAGPGRDGFRRTLRRLGYRRSFCPHHGRVVAPAFKLCQEAWRGCDGKGHSGILPPTKD